MARRTTLTDVAKAADVDVSLVSRVLRGEEVKVKDETRERILASARELDYRPNAIARSLKSAKAGAYGLVIPTFNNPVYAQIITGAEAAVARLSCVLLTLSGEGWDRAASLDALNGGRVDGLLIAGGTSLDVAELRVPWLLVNRTAPGVDRSVVLADAEASRIAVGHLRALGHEHVVFLQGPSESDTARRRFAGFEEAAREAGMRTEPPIQADYTYQGGYAAMRHALGRERRFTGVVAANVASAIGALQALLEHGVALPREVSIVAIHDAEIAGMVNPRLTTVQMPLAQLGQRAIELLTTTTPTERIDEVVDDPMQLVVRDSTGPVPR